MWIPQVTPTNYIPTFFHMPSAATLASLAKTLGQVKSVIVPGGTAASPGTISRHSDSRTIIVGYAPQSLFVL